LDEQEARSYAKIHTLVSIQGRPAQFGYFS
jgi:hypothetical protein